MGLFIQVEISRPGSGVHDSHTPELRWAKATSDFPRYYKEPDSFQDVRAILAHPLMLCLPVTLSF